MTPLNLSQRQRKSEIKSIKRNQYPHFKDGWLQPCRKYYSYHLGEERNSLVQQLNRHPNPMTSRKWIPNNTNEFGVDTSIVKHPDKNTAK